MGKLKQFFCIHDDKLLNNPPPMKFNENCSCQWKMEIKCSKCGRYKEEYSDVYGGMEIVDSVEVVE